MPDVASENLFRQSAMATAPAASAGEPLLTLPPGAAWSVLFVVTSTFALIGFAAWAEYARKETVSGHVEPVSGIVPVHVPRAGYIKQLHVREGESVSAGQPLLLVDADQRSEAGVSADLEVVRLLQLQIAGVNDQIARTSIVTSNELAKLRAQLDGFALEIAEVDEQINLQQKRVDLIEGRVATMKDTADRGYVSRVEYERWIEQALAGRQALRSLQQQRLTVVNRRSELSAQLQQAPLQGETTLRTLAGELSGLRQRLAEAEARRSYVLSAPISGRISAVQTTAGRYVTATQPQLAIVPEGEEFRALLLVPPRAAGFIRAGQQVRIMYDAFPYTRFGLFDGRVSEVASSTLSSSETLGPALANEPHYKVTVALAQQSIRVGLADMPLRAGMLLRADVVLERRSLLDWVLDPLLRGLRT